MESNTEKKPSINVQNQYKKEAKRLRATTFAIAKVERAITSGTIEKSSILLLKYQNNLTFNYSAFSILKRVTTIAIAIV